LLRIVKYEKPYKQNGIRKVAKGVKTIALGTRIYKELHRITHIIAKTRRTRKIKSFG